MYRLMITTLVNTRTGPALSTQIVEYLTRDEATWVHDSINKSNFTPNGRIKDLAADTMIVLSILLFNPEAKT